MKKRRKHEKSLTEVNFSWKIACPDMKTSDKLLDFMKNGKKNHNESNKLPSITLSCRNRSKNCRVNIEILRLLAPHWAQCLKEFMQMSIEPTNALHVNHPSVITINNV